MNILELADKYGVSRKLFIKKRRAKKKEKKEIKPIAGGINNANR